MKKNLKVLLAATICSCSLSMVSFAGTWQAEGANWKYQNDDSSYAANSWAADNGNWYYFDANGYMMTGWVNDNNNWFYLNPTGEMRTEPLIENQVTYYFDAASGVCSNPNAAPATSDGVLTEQQYIDRVNEFIVELNVTMTDTMTDLENADIQQAIQLVNEMKAPFVSFYEVQAPAKYAQAHERYKNGCLAMVQYLDICVQIGNSDDSNEIAELYEKMMSSYQVVTDEFEAGDQLFNAA